jgi:hypothetical protein
MRPNARKNHYKIVTREQITYIDEMVLGFLNSKYRFDSCRGYHEFSGDQRFVDFIISSIVSANARPIRANVLAQPR